MREYENDPLVYYLIELTRELNQANIPILIGGGMSIYLRTRLLTSPIARYPFSIPVRSTNDLDLFLSSDLIIDPDRIEALKRILDKLGYEVVPEARNFQFFKTIHLFGENKVIKVDLLAAPPTESDKRKVEINPPRIKPTGVQGIHAYLTEAAAGIEIGKLLVDFTEIANDPVANEVLFLPSAFNYLILKLHAFEDRKHRGDITSNFGHHHASDIFTTVASMQEQDWEIAQEHRIIHAGWRYLDSANQIRKDNFADVHGWGLIRLRESELYQRQKDTLDPYLSEFMKDLSDLFP